MVRQTDWDRRGWGWCSVDREDRVSEGDHVLVFDYSDRVGADCNCQGCYTHGDLNSGRTLLLRVFREQTAIQKEEGKQGSVACVCGGGLGTDAAEEPRNATSVKSLYPGGRADFHNAIEPGLAVARARAAHSKGPGNAGVTGIGVVILQVPEQAEFFVVVVKLVAGVPAEFFRKPD